MRFLLAWTTKWEQSNLKNKEFGLKLKFLQSYKLQQTPEEGQKLQYQTWWQWNTSPNNLADNYMQSILNNQKNSKCEWFVKQISATEPIEEQITIQNEEICSLHSGN